MSYTKVVLNFSLCCSQENYRFNRQDYTKVRRGCNSSDITVLTMRKLKIDSVLQFHEPITPNYNQLADEDVTIG